MVLQQVILEIYSIFDIDFILILELIGIIVKTFNK